MNWLERHAAARHSRGTHRTLRERSGYSIDIASNDYLGLSRDPQIIEAGVEALRQWGAGATGSRLVSGHTELHTALELALARLLQAPSALVFSSGYLANLAAVTALTDPDTLVLSDAHNHASIIDACRLSRAQVTIYPHADVESVRAALADNPLPRAVIITDAVFSVDGVLAPLRQLWEVAEEAGALLLVDEAHALGVLGNGAGACAAAGIDGENLVRTVTLSKSLGSQGGAVAGAPAVIEHLVNTARSFIFDTGLAPAATGSALAACERILADPALPAAALSSTDTLAQLARDTGWDVAAHDAAVASILVGDAAAAVAAQQICADAGVDIGCFRPPSVPDGVSRLRMTGHADLTDDDYTTIEKALGLTRAEVLR